MTTCPEHVQDEDETEVIDNLSHHRIKSQNTTPPYRSLPLSVENNKLFRHATPRQQLRAELSAPRLQRLAVKRLHAVDGDKYHAAHTYIAIQRKLPAYAIRKYLAACLAGCRSWARLRAGEKQTLALQRRPKLQCWHDDWVSADWKCRTRKYCMGLDRDQIRSISRGVGDDVSLDGPAYGERVEREPIRESGTEPPAWSSPWWGGERGLAPRCAKEWQINLLPLCILMRSRNWHRWRRREGDVEGANPVYFSWRMCEDHMRHSGPDCGGSRVPDTRILLANYVTLRSLWIRRVRHEPMNVINVHAV